MRRGMSSSSVRPSLEQLEERLLLDGTAEQQAIQLFSASPALFVENQGQWADESISYAFQGSGANVLFTDTGPIFQLFQREAVGDVDEEKPLDDPEAMLRDQLNEDPDCTTHSAQFSVHFDGANAVSPGGVEQSETSFNYFVGDQTQWRSNVPGYGIVAYEGVYDGIDLRTWGRRNGLKYEFHVAPGADYREIRVSYEGTDGLWVDAEGALHIQTELGELIEDAPYIYQEVDGQRTGVEGAYSLVDEDTYSFEITGEYDTALELIIDPDLAWSTYLGGGTGDYGWAIAVDSAGNAYVTGETSSPGWATPGAYDTTHNGGRDVFVAKLSSSGSSLLYCTYLGGSGHDYGYGIAVDSAGNAYVTGRTGSPGWATPEGLGQGCSHVAAIGREDSSRNQGEATFWASPVPAFGPRHVDRMGAFPVFSCRHAQSLVQACWLKQFRLKAKVSTGNMEQ